MKREHLFIPTNSTEDEKFNAIETALQRIIRRTHKTVSIVIPPSPISLFSNTVDENNVMMRYIFPAKGEISSAILTADKVSDKGARIRVNVMGSIDRLAFDIDVKDNKITTTDKAYSVSAGDRMEVQVVAGIVGVLWLGMLYTITPSEKKVIQLAIDDIEAKMEGE